MGSNSDPFHYLWARWSNVSEKRDENEEAGTIRRPDTWTVCFYLLVGAPNEVSGRNLDSTQAGVYVIRTSKEGRK